MTTSTENTKWQVLVVRPRSEKKVGRRLRDLGFEACVPTQMQVRAWSDRNKPVEVVLFKNYVFVAADPGRRNDVFRAGNIIRYLSFAGRIATLTDKEAVMIRQLGQLTTPVHLTYEGFNVGEAVEILSGSLAGFTGTVTAVNGHSHLQLALPGLHCFAQVELCGTELRRLQSATLD